MRLVRVKIHTGEFINLAYNTTSGKWEAQLQVPAETSYYQQDHKYGMTFEAWDEENHNVILDRTDDTFGEDLVVRVREQVNPIITLIKPASPFVVDASELDIRFTVTDTGGSVLDLDSVVLKFYEDEYDLDNQYMTVTQIENGISVIFNPPYFIQDGEYHIEIEAKDNDENLSKLSFDFIVDTDPCEFITDRTQADVDYVKELRDKWIAGTITEDEKVAFAHDLKGARNRSDFIRILTNLEYLAEMFSLEFNMPILPEIPNEAYVQALRNYVAAFRQQLPIHPNTPYTPKLPLNTFKKMNDLEQILFDIHDSLQYRFKYYCDDEIWCDEMIGILE